MRTKTGEERIYRIGKPDVTMGSLFRRHCHNVQLQVTSCRFLDEDGQRVLPQQSFEELANEYEADEKDTIVVVLDCMLEQIGGHFRVWH